MFRHSYRYALDVLKAPPAGEDAISQELEYAYWYAKIVLKAPFPLGETVINRNPGYKKLYDKFLETIEKPTRGDHT